MPEGLISTLKKMDELRKSVNSCNDWWQEGNEILQRVHSAIVAMGTFEDPLDPSLSRLTLSQWQLERAKRVVLAILGYLEECNMYEVCPECGSQLSDLERSVNLGEFGRLVLIIQVCSVCDFVTVKDFWHLAIGGNDGSSNTCEEVG